MFTLSGKPLKLVERFIYFDSNISSIENCKSVDCYPQESFTWKVDLSDEIKRDFSKLRLCQYYYIGAPH